MKLFIYEHCPYCIRVRVALAIKNIACEIEYLHDDNTDGHFEKIGRKSVPILQKDDGTYMGESLDIIDYLDTLKGEKMFADKTVRSDILAIITSMKTEFSSLVFTATSQLNFPEISTPSAKAHYINRYLTHLRYDTVDGVINDIDTLKATVQFGLQKISDLLESDNAMVGDEIGMNEIILFSRLYTITALDNIVLPARLSHYLNSVMQRCDLKPLSSWT